MEINPQRTQANLGGKGYQLHRLKEFCTVPRFFVIKFDSFDEIVDTAVQAAIYSHFDKQNFDLVSVRSSATVEDGAASSFAGMFESILNVSRENLIDAVKQVVNSVKSERVRGYCIAKGIDHNLVGMRVIVQQMVKSDVSGVAFTKIQGGDKNITIEAVQGLGDALVSGRVNPDNYLVDRTTLEIREKDVAHHNTHEFIASGDVKELAKVCLEIEKKLGFVGADIEWAFAKGKLYILQARAVTGITEAFAGLPCPTEYKLFWSVPGFDVLRADILMTSTAPLQTLAAIQNSKFNWYTFNTRAAWAEKSGLDKLSDADAFDNYMTEFKEFYATKLPEFGLLANNPTHKNVEIFLKNLTKFFDYYSWTYTAYTNGATLDLLQDKNSILAKTLEKLGDFKNLTREWGNQLLVFDDRPLATLLDNLSKKFNINTGDLSNYKCGELLDLFKGKKVSADEISARVNTVFYYNTPTPNDITYISGEPAKQIIDAFAKANTDSTENVSTSEIRGLVGCTANATEIEGIVYLLEIDYANLASTNAQIEKMPQGDILVTTFTSPEVFTACKKSSAMVTDFGGILSHTAIVARELNIPCIVGTKNATKLIKTGDRVKLNLMTGEVSVL